jgi:hypothetical protein
MQLDLLAAIAGPNPGEAHLHMPPGTLPPMVERNEGAIYNVPDVCGKDRLLVLVPAPIHVKGKDTVPSRWVWTNDFGIAERLIEPKP